MKRVEATDEERIRKLPTWARNEIVNLRRQLAETEAENRIMSGPTIDLHQNPPRGFYRGTCGGTGFGLLLPDRHIVAVGNGVRGVTLSLASEGIDVNGRDPLSIEPRASNRFVIATSKQ